MPLKVIVTRDLDRMSEIAGSSRARIPSGRKPDDAFTPGLAAGRSGH